MICRFAATGEYRPGRYRGPVGGLQWGGSMTVVLAVGAALVLWWAAWGILTGASEPIPDWYPRDAVARRNRAQKTAASWGCGVVLAIAGVLLVVSVAC